MSKSYFYKLVDGEASSPATTTLSKGEWLRMSHSVAKRLHFANELAKCTSSAVHAAGYD